MRTMRGDTRGRARVCACGLGGKTLACAVPMSFPPSHIPRSCGNMSWRSNCRCCRAAMTRHPCARAWSRACSCMRPGGSRTVRGGVDGPGGGGEGGKKGRVSGRGCWGRRKGRTLSAARAQAGMAEQARPGQATDCACPPSPVAGSYRVLATGQEVAIHPSSTLSRGRAGAAPREAIIFGELVRTTKTYARDVTAIELNWLPELVPSFFAKVGQAAT